MSPWKAIDQMDHDELRRYARELVQHWIMQPPDADVSSLVSQMNAVGHRMEEMGIKPLVTIRDGVQL